MFTLDDPRTRRRDARAKYETMGCLLAIGATTGVSAGVLCGIVLTVTTGNDVLKETRDPVGFLLAVSLVSWYAGQIAAIVPATLISALTKAGGHFESLRGPAQILIMVVTMLLAASIAVYLVLDAPDLVGPGVLVVAGSFVLVILLVALTLRGNAGRQPAGDGSNIPAGWPAGWSGGASTAWSGAVAERLWEVADNYGTHAVELGLDTLAAGAPTRFTYDRREAKFRGYWFQRLRNSSFRLGSHSAMLSRRGIAPTFRQKLAESGGWVVYELVVDGHSQGSWVASMRDYAVQRWDFVPEGGTLPDPSWPEWPLPPASIG
jgi:hypothetical protein